MQEICTLRATRRGLETDSRWELVRHSQRKRGVTDRIHLRSTAPAPDPTQPRFDEFSPRYLTEDTSHLAPTTLQRGLGAERGPLSVQSLLRAVRGEGTHGRIYITEVPPESLPAS